MLKMTVLFYMCFSMFILFYQTFLPFYYRGHSSQTAKKKNLPTITTSASSLFHPKKSQERNAYVISATVPGSDSSELTFFFCGREGVRQKSSQGGFFQMLHPNW